MLLQRLLYAFEEYVPGRWQEISGRLARRELQESCQKLGSNHDEFFGYIHTLRYHNGLFVITYDLERKIIPSRVGLAGYAKGKDKNPDSFFIVTKSPFERKIQQRAIEDVFADVDASTDDITKVIRRLKIEKRPRLTKEIHQEVTNLLREYRPV